MLLAHYVKHHVLDECCRQMIPIGNERDSFILGRAAFFFVIAEQFNYIDISVLWNVLAFGECGDFGCRDRRVIRNFQASISGTQRPEHLLQTNGFVVNSTCDGITMPDVELF